jgi:hypothetical protein
MTRPDSWRRGMSEQGAAEAVAADFDAVDVAVVGYGPVGAVLAN